MSQEIEVLSEQACFGGTQGFYKHHSQATGTPMQIAVYQPPRTTSEKCPVLYYLAGLTCTEETATIKAGAQRLAAEKGLILVMPDTSPRGAGIDGEDDDWDFGTGAGFYLKATKAPWSNNYNMYDYITEELPAAIANNFNADTNRTGITGHSMGGHGALTIALKNPDKYMSVSAFAPICAPMQCPWGMKAFSNYLGENQSSWTQYDATELVKTHQISTEILIDQGLGDNFLQEQLHPHLFEAACRQAGQSLRIRQHEGYDHSYYFIQTFMPDHIAHHAKILGR
jgi:S-formylglutathione hydrolase